MAQYHSARNYDIEELDELEELLQSKCSNAYEAYREHPASILYRGMRGNRNDVFIQDTRNTNRSAENTDNYVTLLSEVLPSWSHLPPRSKVISATPSQSMATDYADGNEDNVFVLVPTNESILTYSGASDFWGSLPGIYDVIGSGSGVSAINFHIRNLVRSSSTTQITTAQSLVNWCKEFDTKAQTTQFDVQEQKNPLLRAYRERGQSMFELFNDMLNPSKAVVSKQGRIITELPQQEVGVYGTAVYVRRSVWELL